MICKTCLYKVKIGKQSYCTQTNRLFAPLEEGMRMNCSSYEEHTQSIKDKEINALLLKKHESAIELAKKIEKQFNVFSNMDKNLVEELISIKESIGTFY